MKKLSTWMTEEDNNPVAIVNDSIITKAQFCEKVTAWQALLPLSAGQKWAVYHNDTLEFLAILFALWQAECTACIPGDNCTATVNRLGDSIAGFIGEFDNAWKLPAGFHNKNPTPYSWRTLEDDFPALEIYTSGSSGSPKPIIKNLYQIDSELQSLEQLWPIPMSAVVLSTVTHQHLFGLTFRLFWPLAKGQLFHSTHCPFTEDIYRLASQAEHFVLISTPAHLSRLNHHLDWSRLAGKCVATISSAAPLKYEDSRQASQLLGTPILEIYGSSETGALAWRHQSSKGADLWTLLPEVTFQENAEKYRVKGAHIASEYELLSDNIEYLSDGCFRLCGRKDNIVKVEGKRLSISKLERTIEESPWVQTAKALIIRKKREEVAVVIELNNLGNSLLEQQSKKWLSAQLRTQLKRSFEPILLPRRWRFVSVLPYNQQGKLPMEALQTLFQPVDVKWPTELSQQLIENHCEFSFHIPKELIYFDGHFTDTPILPGITQTHWAQHYGRKAFGFSGTFTQLENIKFQQVIFPNSEVKLRLEFCPEKQKLTFQYTSAKGVHSSGKICFE